MEQLRLPPNLATDTTQHVPRTAAQKQVSAAEILTDAHESRASQFQRPKQSIQDLEELRSYQLAKRRDYEQQLNKNRLNYPQWMRYAKWELEHNQDFRRFRSIMERALEVDAKHVPFWVRYIECELLHQNVNHARNLLERGTSILPRVDKLWYIYVQTEESIGNFVGVRQVFERWLKWKPDANVWETYISFEQRYNEEGHVRSLYLRYVAETGHCGVWLQWARFEAGKVATDEQVARTRGVFEAAVDYVMEKKREDIQERERRRGIKGDTNMDQERMEGMDGVQGTIQERNEIQEGSPGIDSDFISLMVLWIDWEYSQGEEERAKSIYQKVVESELLNKETKVKLLDRLDMKVLKTDQSAFSMTQKRLRYEQVLAANSQDYDTWWEYAKFAEKTEGVGRCMQVLQDATSTTPTDTYKSLTWRRYVFLWIKRALYMEYYVQDTQKAREIWKSARSVVPLKCTFGKLWVHSAEFELRNGTPKGNAHVTAYRKTMGAAIGQCCVQVPKPKIFKSYIHFELMLGEYARVRKLYEKWAELAVACDAQKKSTSAVSVFHAYISFEKELGESERVVALYYIALSQISGVFLDEYVAFLKDEFRYTAARDLLQKSITNAHGWIRLALFESSILTLEQMDLLQAGEGGELRFEVGAGHVTASRRVFEQGYKELKSKGDGKGANELLDSWREYELTHGTEEYAEKVEKKRPKQVARRHMQDGVEQMYYEYEFPEAKPDLSKFLANAKKWKAGE